SIVMDGADILVCRPVLRQTGMSAPPRLSSWPLDTPTTTRLRSGHNPKPRRMPMSREELHELQTALDRLRRNQRILLSFIVAMGVLLLVAAWHVQEKPSRKLEVLDEQGRVRARIETGKIVLFNSKGEEKARLTADENNGNLVLNGPGQKRLEVFMDPQ